MATTTSTVVLRFVRADRAPPHWTLRASYFVSGAPACTQLLMSFAPM